MFGLLGPNGAGKTTLMRILAGLLESSSGLATLDGESMLDRPERVWEVLGYLPQDFGFFPHLTGEKMLEYLLRLKGVGAPQGLRVMSRLAGAGESFVCRPRKVKTYSGGMRQRLGIAQAIAGNPRLMIVDEPTAGLDPEERLRFYRLLSELAADRIVLLSTHIVEDVAVLCPRFAVIRSGRLVANTTPSEAREAIEGTIYEGSIPAESYEELEADPAQCVTQAYLVEGRNRVRVYEPKGTPPGGFAPVAPTLEDAYLVSSERVVFPVRVHLRLASWPMAPRSCTAVMSEVSHDGEIGARVFVFPDRVPERSDLSFRGPFFACALVLATAWGLSGGNVRIVSGDASVGGTKVGHHLRICHGDAACDLHDDVLCLFHLRRRGHGDHPGRGVATGGHAPCDGASPASISGPSSVPCWQVVSASWVFIWRRAFLLPPVAQCSGAGFSRCLPCSQLSQASLIFSVPTIVFLAGVSFAIGEWTRRPMLVFLLPVAIVILNGFFLWEWSPSWLDPRVDYALHDDRLGGVSLAERDLAQGGPRGQLLQHGGDPARPGIFNQPCRFHWPGPAGRGSQPLAFY